MEEVARLYRRSIARVMGEDHDRLGELLCAVEAGRRRAWHELRHGLARHIALEERLLFPLLRTFAPELGPVLLRLREDHGNFAALLVPPPLPPFVEELRLSLAGHDALEEAPDGPYESLDQRLTAAAREALVERLLRWPMPQMRPPDRSWRAHLAATRRMGAARDLRVGRASGPEAPESCPG